MNQLNLSGADPDPADNERIEAVATNTETRWQSLYIWMVDAVYDKYK